MPEVGQKDVIVKIEPGGIMTRNHIIWDGKFWLLYEREVVK